MVPIEQDDAHMTAENQSGNSSRRNDGKLGIAVII